MKILGIDYGRKKMGLAVGDTRLKLAEPLQVLTISNFKFQISNLVNQHAIGKIIIGVPGGKIETEIRDLGEKIKKHTNLPVEYFDETLTTQEAQKVLRELGKKRKARRKMEDAIAAAIMLEWYLERGKDNV